MSRTSSFVIAAVPMRRLTGLTFSAPLSSDPPPCDASSHTAKSSAVLLRSEQVIGSSWDHCGVVFPDEQRVRRWTASDESVSERELYNATRRKGLTGCQSGASGTMWDGCSPYHSAASSDTTSL
jgi:hypothetical protein